MDNDLRTEHWNAFYHSRAAPASPSQFGVFVHGEYPGLPIIDFGCGSGRDTIFFADQGHSVIGVDSSLEAVQACRELTGSRRNTVFMNADVSEDETFEKLTRYLSPPPPAVVIYARFFLHAITDDEQRLFLEICRKVSTHCKVFLAVEFRTNRDRQLTKVTPAHYRRYITPVDLVSDAVLLGFTPLYSVEGFGYAKFRSDDAHVARIIFKS